jgi:hypothetical protein
LAKMDGAMLLLPSLNRHPRHVIGNHQQASRQPFT